MHAEMTEVQTASGECSPSPPSGASQPEQLHALLIHGIPRYREQPTTQLDALARQCHALGISTEHYRWCEPDRAGIVGLIRLLEDPQASFTVEHAERFGCYFRQQQRDRKLVVITYSAGGAFFYRWLVTQATPADLARIALVISIGAPRQVPPHFRLPGVLSRAVTVRNEAQQTPEGILLPLAEAGIGLRVIVGPADETVPLQYCAFADRSENEQVTVEGADHAQLCNDSATLAHVRRWLHEISSSGRRTQGGGSAPRHRPIARRSRIARGGSVGLILGQTWQLLLA